MVKKMSRVIFMLFIFGCVIGYVGYTKIFYPNTGFAEDEKVLLLNSNTSVEDFHKQLVSDSIVNDLTSFQFVSKLMKYTPSRLQGGKFIIKKGMNSKELVGLFRSKAQSSVNLTFNNVRDLHQLAGKISKNIELDSISLDKYLHSKDIQAKLGVKAQEEVMSHFIPNTYKVFWNISAEEIVDRMSGERKKFWNEDRLSKMNALEMTKEEVYTLASIVEKESQYGPERPTIAGLYLNRLKRGIALQADPTVVFGVGDFTIRRVLNKHLAHDSPYNTYMHQGLPPGPIYMPSISSIDAVLNYERHEYLFMCAKPGYGTKHAFAKTSRGHTNNANKYRAWLNEQGIKK